MYLKNIFEKLPLFFLLILSFFFHFWFLWYPPNVVFDEAHFGLYATKYLSRQYYFDIHPPFGKLLLSLFAFLGKVKPNFYFIPDSFYEDFNYLALRFLPAFLGSLFPLLIYLFVGELGFSKKAAILAGFLVLFDNAILVQSRLILLDMILLFFIFLSLYFFILTKKIEKFSKKWYFLNFLTALFLGLTISVKLTGFGVLLIIWIFEIIKEKKPLSKKEKLLKIFFFLFLPLLIYFFVFLLHLSLASHPCFENCGAVLDEYSEGKNGAIFNIPPKGNLISKFFIINLYMLLGNISGFSQFFYQSKWYQWPLMIKPIPYFLKEVSENKISTIYFLGNPLVWLAGLWGILFFLYSFFFKKNLRKDLPNLDFLFFSYLVYLLPFSLVKRFLLLYTYLPALTFSIIIFSIIFQKISKDRYLLIFLFLSFFVFLYFLPLSYGIPINKNFYYPLRFLP